MRLLRLHIAEFKNLRRLDIDFESESPFSVVVGRNGAGKSNVLEALVLIFRHLDLNEKPPFRYRIQYECRGRILAIDATGEKFIVEAGSTRETLEVLTRKEFEKVDQDGHRSYLPAHVFGYYSGPSNRFEAHFDVHHKRFYDWLLGKPTARAKTAPKAHIRPLFYARNIHSQFVLLAFFSGLGDSSAEFLEEYLGIRGLESVLFVLNEPPWATSKEYKNFGWFWNAKGVVRGFLRRLYEEALAPIRMPKVRVSTTPTRSEARDHFYLYLKDAESLGALASQYESQKAFFAALESAHISELVREVRVVVRVGRGADALTFRELSEGEQQLLMVLGLLKFTQQEESLFLLDEPDTHLNPAWSVQYLDLLRTVIGNDRTSQLIMTTHDPLVIAGRVKEEVRVLERADDGTISAAEPLEDPRGMGVAALLTSEVYGLRSELDLYTLEQMELQRRLAQKESLTPSDKRELKRVTAWLSELGFTRSNRDPAYASWAQLLARIESRLGIEGADLTKKQRDALQAAVEDATERVARRVR